MTNAPPYRIDVDQVLGFLESSLLHLANFVVFLASIALIISDNVTAAIIAAGASVFNTVMILRYGREARRVAKDVHQDMHKRRLVVVKYGGDTDDEETVVITPEERRAIEAPYTDERREGE